MELMVLEKYAMTGSEYLSYEDRKRQPINEEDVFEKILNHIRSREFMRLKDSSLL